jgi:hypothetical protein
VVLSSVVELELLPPQAARDSAMARASIIAINFFIDQFLPFNFTRQNSPSFKVAPVYHAGILSSNCFFVMRL